MATKAKRVRKPGALRLNATMIRMRTHTDNFGLTLPEGHVSFSGVGAEYYKAKDVRKLAAWLLRAAAWFEQQNKQRKRTGRGKK